MPDRTADRPLDLGDGAGCDQHRRSAFRRSVTVPKTDRGAQTHAPQSTPDAVGYLLVAIRVKNENVAVHR
jgi:hypothetical protein